MRPRRRDGYLLNGQKLRWTSGWEDMTHTGCFQHLELSQGVFKRRVQLCLCSGVMWSQALPLKYAGMALKAMTKLFWAGSISGSQSCVCLCLIFGLKRAVHERVYGSSRVGASKPFKTRWNVSDVHLLPLCQLSFEFSFFLIPFSNHRSLSLFSLLRYYFKKASDEFECGAVFEEVWEDATVLPMYEGKVLGKVERMDWKPLCCQPTKSWKKITALKRLEQRTLCRNTLVFVLFLFVNIKLNRVNISSTRGAIEGRRANEVCRIQRRLRPSPTFSTNQP